MDLSGFDEITVDGIPAIRLPGGRILPVPRGGDGEPNEPEPFQLPVEIPESLDALDDEALRGLWTELETARAAQVETAASLTGLAALRESRAAIDAIVAAQNGLTTEIAGRLEAREGLGATAEPPPEPPAPAEPEVETSADAPTDAAPADPAPETAPAVPVAELVTAAIGGDALDGPPAEPPPNTEPARPRVAMRAAAGTDNQGQEIDLPAIAEMVNRNRTGPHARVALAYVAGFQEMPEFRDEILTTDNALSRNDALAREARSRWREQFDANREAHVAAICDPLEIRRDIPEGVTAAEPFADAQPSAPIGRLGYQFTPPLTLSEIAAGVTTWGEEEQGSVDPSDPDTWKPCVPIDCPRPETVIAKAIVGCFSFDNTTDMSNPERIRDAMTVVNAQRARRKEAHLLRLFDFASHHYNATLVYGAVDGFIHQVLTALVQGRHPERLDDTPYLCFLPPGLLATLVIDRDHQRLKSDFERGEIIAYIEGELAAAGFTVRLVELLDVATGSPDPFPSLNSVGPFNVTALPQLGGDVRPFKVRLEAAEDALYGTTGEINMGIERSPELNLQNRAQWFAEEYVLFAKHGKHPWFTLNMVACPTGSRAAASTVFACPDGES